MVYNLSNAYIGVALYMYKLKITLETKCQCLYR